MKKSKINSNTLLLLITVVLFIVMYGAGCVVYASKGFTRVQTFLNILINNAGARIIRKHFENSKPKTGQKPLSETKNGYQKQMEIVSNSPANAVISAKDETIKLLKEQLKAKDDQLANMQKLMDQNQQLLLHTQEENKHLLALNTPDKDNKVQSVHDGEYHEAPKAADKDNEQQDQTVRSNEEKKPWWKLW